MDLHAEGARVVSVFGKRSERTLVEMPTTLAEQLFEEGLVASARTDVIDAALRDVAAIRVADEALGDSALAAAAVALAYEVAHPYNSATSKSMCFRELREHFDLLRELAPAKKESNPVDELRARRTARRAGLPEASDQPGPAGGNVGVGEDGA